TLGIDPRLLSVVVDPFEVALADRMGAGHRRQLRLDLLPDRQRVDEGAIALQRGDEHLAPPALLELPAEVGRDLEAPLVVDGGLRAASKHSAPAKGCRPRWRLAGV